MRTPRGLDEMIDQYVADALGATGTRASRPALKPRQPTPVKPMVAAAPVAEDIEIDVSDMAVAAPAGDEHEALIPVEVDDRTDPEVPNIFSFDEGTAYLAPAFQRPSDPIPTLSRIRTARGTPPPPAEIELDEDEITNVLGGPSKR